MGWFFPPWFAAFPGRGSKAEGRDRCQIRRGKSTLGHDNFEDAGQKLIPWQGRQAHGSRCRLPPQPNNSSL